MGIHIIKKILHKIGLDKAIIFTSATNVISAFGNVISMILVVKYITIVEQGYYYTINSLLSLSIFFELGLGVVIKQIATQVFTNLNWN